MNITDTCERCDGTGADPRQAYFDDVVDLCGECRGDGVVPGFERELDALLQSREAQAA
jgi:DnaJ-class molecular chaperone